MNPDVSAYIAKVETPWQKEVLENLRSIIFETIPDVEEKIKWGSIGYDYHGPLMWVFTAQNWVHISYSYGSLLDSSHGLFEKTENKAQRTIKLLNQDDFPEKALQTLTKQAAENNQKGKKVSFNPGKSEKREFSLPAEFKKILDEDGLLSEYMKRPFYQQSGWIRWIESAKKPQTRAKRIDQMIAEIKAGDKYMKMPW